MLFNFAADKQAHTTARKFGLIQITEKKLYHYIYREKGNADKAMETPPPEVKIPLSKNEVSSSTETVTSKKSMKTTYTDSGECLNLI